MLNSALWDTIKQRKSAVKKQKTVLQFYRGKK